METVASKAVKYILLHLEIIIDAMLVCFQEQNIQLYMYSLGRDKGAPGKPQACCCLQVKLPRVKCVDSETTEKLRMGTIGTLIPV